MTEPVTVVDPDDVEGTEPAAGVRVGTVLSAGEATLTITHLSPGTASEWRRHAEGRYGYVRSGRGRVEYGTGGERAARLDAGDFYHLPAGRAHRLVTDDEALDLLAVAAPTDDARTDAATIENGGERSSSPGDGPEQAAAPRVVGPGGLVPAVETPNLTRETPFPDAEDVLLMRVRAAGGADAGWHHHGENRYFGHVVDGRSETEYGRAGDRVAEVRDGECFTVRQGLVHRDTNPTDEEHEGIIWLCGGEPWVVNVDGPGGSEG